MTTSLRRTPLARLLTISLCTGALAIAGCNRTDTPSVPAPAPSPPAAAAPAPAPAAPAPAAYTPPPAEQLYQLVAPVALYPDKLVAQVLAGATYPEQITAAHGWLVQNAALKGGALADAANQQPWDPSVKALTAFRPVLDQMAGNIAWTEALGQAYYNDPADVMNAIQVMRQRASAAGRLKNNDKLRVASAATPRNYAPAPDMQPVYAGPAVVEPPPQFITIEPAQPDVVYVPSYDPQRIYGEPVPVYPGYAYTPPVEVAPGYGRGQVAAGAFTFGLGVVVGAALQRHDWGWRSWDVNWGAPRYRDRDSDRDRAVPPAYARPAVIYNNSTYISRSTTVVNNVRNVYNNAPRSLPPGAPAPNFAAAPSLPPPQNAQFAQQQQQQRQQQARQQQAFMRQQQEQQQAAQQAQQLQARQRQQEQQERQAQQQAQRQAQQQAQQQAQRQARQQAQQQERLARQQAHNAPTQAPQALLQQQQQDQARRQQAAQQQQARAASQQAQQQQQAMQERQQQRQSAQQEQSRRQQAQQQQAQQQARVLQQQQAQQQQMQRQQAQQQARQQQQEQMHRQQEQQAQAARQQQQQAMQQQRQQQQAQLHQQQQQQQAAQRQQQAQQHAAAAAAAHRRPPGRPGEPPKDQP
ncbi:hypothetical protein J2738_000908 [Variovorax paradoxus]|uniref:DUF3300 domain-containing protein n=1 Tax=Variovorax paradoxus TaxID=34073 RepID=A0AAE4BU94_VARPD|nr:DUF3300 domain-containing protein [Variovorax paradoxus]MDR6424786.1 hypothetical protein [Variovorax paradoxus]